MRRMHIATVLTPADLTPELLRDRVAIVIDQLRATTTITTALGSGATAVHAFGSLDAAIAGRDAESGPTLLAGEVRCVKPDGFDLGNSPEAFTPEKVRGRIVMLSTTNGTRALLRTQAAAMTLVGCLRNAAAVANVAADAGRDVVLVCAGTGGEPTDDDTLTAGVLASAIERYAPAKFDETTRAAIAFGTKDLEAFLRTTLGGRNLIDVHLGSDITFAAQLDAVSAVGRVVEYRVDRAVMMLVTP
jgi:2-phosphosulfolactate phosphatase